ncbi:heparin lyase I family protein [Rhizobium altiplani]|nr:heparin lyase I family protein [Rhizobium altiplani]
MQLSYALAVMLIAGAPNANAASPTVRDEFDATSVSDNWFSCGRDENRFSFGKIPDEARSAATQIVRALPQNNVLAFAWHPKGCAREDGTYDRDGSERSELWEAEKVLAPMGTDIWYRFDMFVDASITPTTGRFVIGQWKQTNSPQDAPILAQRFNGRAFTVSIEQDNADPNRDPKNVLCRVFIASQETAPVEPGFGNAHTLVKPAQLFSLMKNQMLSVGHDAEDLAHGAAPLSLPGLTGCAQGLSVTRYNSLPDPFGKWTTMVYHLRLVSDKTGLIEIWADGKKISKTEGVIGFKPFLAKEREYFKFGSYRNHAEFETVTRLDHFIRSERKEDVDPDGTLAPP